MLGVAFVLENQVELLRHDRRHLARHRHARELQDIGEAARPIECLPAGILVVQARLLAKRRAQDQRRVVARQIHELRQQLVHLLIPKQDRRLVLGLLFAGWL